LIRSILKQNNPALRASFPLLVIFLFATFSAVFEIVPYIGKIRPQLILATFGLMAVAASGQAIRVFRAPMTRAMALFTFWFMMCIPLGVWPGGSFFVFTEYWYKSALVYVMIAGLVTTVPQAKRIFFTIAYAVGFLAAGTIAKGGQQFGRLILDNTRYANPNDLAWALLIGLTFLGYLYVRGNRGQKIAAVVLALPVVVAMLKTGSRSGSLGFGVLAFAVFTQVSRQTKIKVAIFVPLTVILLLAAAPPSIRMRFTTYFGDVDPTEAKNLRAATIGSTEARKLLLKDSLRITASHPLFGVGPGNFPVEQDKLAKARGEKSMWHVSHNTYTELSSEMGVPGLAIYIWMVVLAFKILNGIIRTKTPAPVWRELRLMALTLRAVFWAFLVVAFFASLAYNTDVPILVGIATALDFMAQQQRAIDRSERTRLAAEPEGVIGALEPVAVG
jgi:O-antigen ligase